MPKSREKAIKNAEGRLKAVKSGKLAKFKRTLRELRLGKKAYLKKKKVKTKRTGDVESALAKYGLSASDIKRLRGKR